ncbi:MAG: peptide ABC transporter substrate-binding protein [Halomonas sp.]|nr:MAG: peptide ABC transporter substrate-binding protein [Halomonas sp.]
MTASESIQATHFGPVSRRALLCASVGALALIGAGTLAAQTPPETPTGQVIVGLSQEATVFNPLMAGIEVDETIWMQIYSPLWYSGPDGTLLPELAAEIPTAENGGISEDGRTWTIHLRDDVTWHDGTPFTAEDVKFSLELINSPDFRAGNRMGHELIEEITVTDPHEITWTMQEPYAPYHALLAATYMVPRHIVEAADDPHTALASAPVGTGPFVWGARASGDSITLHANEDFFGDGPYMERAVFRYIPEQTALYAQFRAGQLDATIGSGIPANYFAEAQELPGLVVEAAPNASLEIVMPNLEHPALQDVAVRRALFAAIDSEAIIEAVYYDLHQPNVSFAPIESWAYNDALEPHVFDIDEANRLLDEAGWEMGSGNVREKDGVPLAFDISTTTGNALREQAQQLMIETWRAIGAQVSINNMPAAVIWGDFYRLSEFDTLLVGTTFRTGMDPDPSNRFLSSAIPAQGGAGANYMQWQNEEADALLHEGITTFDTDRRREIYHRLQEIVRDELPIIPIYQYQVVEGRKEGLEGYVPNINARHNSWNLREWYWAQD